MIPYGPLRLINHSTMINKAAMITMRTMIVSNP